MTQNQTPVTTTEHKIGKVTYLVCSSASERATDTLDKKIKKLGIVPSEMQKVFLRKEETKDLDGQLHWEVIE